MTENRRFVSQFSQTIRDRTTHFGKETLSFFGINEPSSNEIDAWNQRRLRFTLQKFGNINTHRLKVETTESNYPVTPSFDDIDESEPNAPFRANDKNKPAFNRGRSAPGFLNRQISLHSNLVAPIDKDTIVSTSSYGYRKVNAVTALSRMISMKKSKVSVPNHSKDIIMKIHKNASISNQNVNIIDQQNEEFFANFSAFKAKENNNKILLKHNLRKTLHDHFIFRLICCLMKHDKESEDICSRIDDTVQYRPYFTYWITCVQILVFIVSCSYYGFAPVGLKITTEYRKDILLPNQAIENMCWYEYDNLWLGPRQSDLIRLGARYSPCMRTDVNLNNSILNPQIQHERLSGCCIRNDGGGCHQTVERFCSKTLSTWVSNLKYKNNDSHRSFGPVCGQDPDYCRKPLSMNPFKWSDDITKWPVCLEKNNLNKSTLSKTTHMQCEITGRPCCVGIKGECIITTRSHCEFMRGYFHQEAYLCSQINCLGEICGMLSFADPENPDQFYRLFISLFLHVGIVHLIITVAMQIFFLRDFEKLMGWLRTILIYTLSGIIGNLMSAVFLPYQVEAGPSGSCFAFLGVIIIEFLKSWKLIKSPWKVLLKYFIFTLFLFIIGLLPWIDNYAHLSGLISGILLSFVFLPFLGIPDAKLIVGDLSSMSSRDFNKLKKSQRRKALVWRISTLTFSASLWLLGLFLLVFQFKNQPLIDCKWCKYLTCIPIAKSFCDNMDVNVTAQTPCLPFIT